MATWEADNVTVLHTGSSKQFSSNWESIFAKGKKKPAKKSTTAKKSTKKSKRK